jgi:DNA-binding MarR family transcriptional regulator
MSLPQDLADCLVLNTVAAARALLRRHDARLKPFGVTVQQFALLAAVRFYPGESVAALARHAFLDRTSLTRNLALLERKGLVQRRAGPGKVRLCELTPAGDALLTTLRPEWERARAELVADLPGDDIDTYLSVARGLARD